MLSPKYKTIAVANGLYTFPEIAKRGCKFLPFGLTIQTFLAKGGNAEVRGSISKVF